jgi:hypothetical protein
MVVSMRLVSSWSTVGGKTGARLRLKLGLTDKLFLVLLCKQVRAERQRRDMTPEQLEAEESAAANQLAALLD